MRMKIDTDIQINMEKSVLFCLYISLNFFYLKNIVFFSLYYIFIIFNSRYKLIKD